MSNYYKNSDKDISKQIYLTNNVNIKDSFKPIFDASLNASYEGLNNVNINEKINTTNYLYDGVDICNNCFAVYADYTSTNSTTNVSVPTWCTKIRAVLIGGGGGGSNNVNSQNTTNDFVNSHPEANNTYYNVHYNRDSNGNSQTYQFDGNSADSVFNVNYRYQNSNDGYRSFQFQNNRTAASTGRFVNVFFEQTNTQFTGSNDLFSTNWVIQHNELREAILYIKKYPISTTNNVNPNTRVDYDKDYDESDNNQKSWNWSFNQHAHLHWGFIGNYTPNTTNANSPYNTVCGGGGGGGEFLYLKDYTANPTMSVAIGGGGGANTDGGDTKLTVGTTTNSTIFTAKGGSGSVNYIGGNANVSSAQDNTVSYSGTDGGTSNDTATAGTGGNSGLSISGDYGKGGNGSSFASGGATNAGGSGTKGYCRIYFLAN